MMTAIDASLTTALCLPAQGPAKAGSQRVSRALRSAAVAATPAHFSRLEAPLHWPRKIGQAIRPKFPSSLGDRVNAKRCGAATYSTDDSTDASAALDIAGQREMAIETVRFPLPPPAPLPISL